MLISMKLVRELKISQYLVCILCSVFIRRPRLAYDKRKRKNEIYGKMYAPNVHIILCSICKVSEWMLLDLDLCIKSQSIFKWRPCSAIKRFFVCIICWRFARIFQFYRRTQKYNCRTKWCLQQCLRKYPVHWNGKCLS